MKHEILKRCVQYPVNRQLLGAQYAVLHGIMYVCTDKLQLERTVQTVKDYVMAHDSSPFLVLLLFPASLAELISEMWLRVFKYKWNMF